MLEKRKNCKKCFSFLKLSDFHVNNRLRDGHETICKTCRRMRDSELYAINRTSPRYRAKIIFLAAKDRAKKKKIEFSLSFEKVLKAVENGFCEVTGIPFDLNRAEGRTRNPHAPSIDRKRNDQGYTNANSQVVINMYNSGKGEHDENEFVKMCENVKNMKDDQKKVLLNVTETAAFFGIKKRTFHYWIKNKTLPVEPVKGLKPPKWSVVDLNNWLNGNTSDK